MVSTLVIAFTLSIGTYSIAHTMIPVFMPLTEKAGLWGKDLCKKGKENEDKKMYLLLV